MKPNILIIDDEKTIRDYLSNICIDGSYSVQNCSNAEEAKELINKYTFSVLIIDIILPKQSGLEFIKEIQDSGNNTPVIAITGSRELEHAQEAVRLNVFDYFLKPFENKHLLQAIKNAHTQFILNRERSILEKNKDEYRQKLEQEVKEKVQQLELSEQKYRQLIEQSIVGVAIISDGLVVYNNNKFATIFGFSNSSGIDSTRFIDLVLKHKQKALQTLMQACLSQQRDNTTIQFPAHKKKSKEIYVQAWLSSIEYNSNPALLVVITDITEQHLAQQREKKYALELLKENKMASIGQLTAGITHNLNTPISIIQGNAELLQYKNPNSNEVNMILKQTSRMNELIHTIITKGKYELNYEEDEIDLNSLLKTEIEFLKANLYFKHYIDCTLDLDDSIPSLYGIYSDYSQSISVIIQNSIDAMYKFEKRELFVQTKKNKSSVKLVIKDSGVGIERDVLEQIFEPFFTTKPAPDEKIQDDKAPRGTGLGLSMADKIFKKYDIQVEVNSNVGSGAEFILSIPVKKHKKREK
ncbi:MAG: response regulator [Calditrichaeota bacterium]|nr:MAG: response regulator [Calditrichota bacterium]MBL1204227.1 response regulator [Calditrichota bacterium]NOG44057.1 response regulator [Calditrichota bacterium]